MIKVLKDRYEGATPREAARIKFRRKIRGEPEAVIDWVEIEQILTQAREEVLSGNAIQ
jgi:hypothetical protein